MPLAALHTALLEWFAIHREDLPWRRSGDPYAVWLSETMLQQTQVATVIPYFERFMQRFPTIEALAAASLDDVLKQWEGLGYYSRARNLHKAARLIVEKYGGHLPAELVLLRELPGVGPYTAGAIASLAFGIDAPVLDGNVIRVFARWLDLEADVTLSTTRRRLWQQAADWLPEGRAARWNEALMELGRLVCIPTSPRCDRCPVEHFCLARQHGTADRRPVRPVKSAIPHYDVAAGVIYGRDGRLLIARRPLEGLLGGLWEFPGGKREANESLPDCLAREVAEELGIGIEVGPQITTVRHAYTHFRITLYAFSCIHVEGEPQAIGCDDWAWVTLDELERFAFPATDRQIIAALQNGGGQLVLGF